LIQLTDHSAIEQLVDQIITNFPKQVAEYKAGKETLFGFFVGQIMKASNGKASPDLVNQLLKQKLK
jgi:aspartyl-tRNA(Asn)/glutamyl-tRNA(Gln) amidotransferase subunit B